MTETMNPTAALDRLEELYNQSVSNLRTAVGTFLRTGERADPEARARGLFSYPELRVSWFGERPANLEQRAFARMSRPGVYSTTITRPDLYRPYLLEQLSLLEADYGATFEVRPSEQEIPFPYVLDSTIDLNAANGVAEYCANLGPMYYGLAREQADPREWAGKFRTRRTSIDGLPARTTDRYIAGDPGTVPE